MMYLADLIREMSPGLIDDGFVGYDEWHDRLDALKIRGLSPTIIPLLLNSGSVPMLERVEAMTPEQIAELNAAA